MFDELGLRSHVQDMYFCRLELVRGEVGEHNGSNPHGSCEFVGCYVPNSSAISWVISHPKKDRDDTPSSTVLSSVSGLQ